MRNLLVLGFIAAVSAAPAIAQEVTVSGNVALATDYTFRGVSQTDGPAVQGGFDATFGDSGFYLGTWASNINFGGGSDLELDVYGGYKFALGAVNMDTLVVSVYDDVDARLHPVAKGSLLAHLLKLEEDGRVARDSTDLNALWSLQKNPSPPR